MKKYKTLPYIIVLLVFVVAAFLFFKSRVKTDDSLRIISSTENKVLETKLTDYAESQGIKLSFEYAGTLDIINKLNTSSYKYDAAWLSNSIWINRLSKEVKIKNWKFTSINPIVFGISASKFSELGLSEDNVYTKDFVNTVKDGKLKFLMPSATQTNSGASAYLGFVSCLAGNPQILTEEHLDDESLKKDLRTLFSGVSRSSGSEEYIKDFFLNGDYEALIDYEASILQLNQELVNEGKEPLKIIYPKDGVALSDSPFAYIDNSDSVKYDKFKIMQDYTQSEEFQIYLTSIGRRGGYGGLVPYADSKVFNPNWGVNTKEYLSAVKYPSSAVINKALNLYQEELRKPVNVVFCIDYSGSMDGSGIEQLYKAADYILTDETASMDYIQFSDKDIITVVPFSTRVGQYFGTSGGYTHPEILHEIKSYDVSGNTNIYGAVQQAFNILENADYDNYNCSVILMTDGRANVGTFYELENYYNTNISHDIPVYGITFGAASSDELEEIADMTNGAVFDGTTDLVKAFITVRGFN